MNGRGVPANQKLALTYYIRAAESEVTQAFFAVGLAYEDGKGVAKNMEEAVKYYKLGISKGNSDCAIAMGRLYEEGREIEINEERARKYYRKASDLGSAKGQFLLGHFLENGIGGEVDVASALENYKAAGNRENYGSTDALCALAWCYMNGKGVTRDTEEGKRLYQLAEQRGDTDAGNILRSMSSNAPSFNLKSYDRSGSGSEEDDDLGLGLFD